MVTPWGDGALGGEAPEGEARAITAAVAVGWAMERDRIAGGLGA